MDENNRIVKLVNEGMQMEKVDKFDRAQELYTQAWNESSNDWEKCIAAHFVPRNITDLQEKLNWNLVAVNLANKVNNDEVKGYYPSLYVNVGLCYEKLLNYSEAKNYYNLASDKISDLPVNHESEKYNEGIKQTIRESISRLEEKIK